MSEESAEVLELLDLLAGCDLGAGVSGCEELHSAEHARGSASDCLRAKTAWPRAVRSKSCYDSIAGEQGTE